MFWKKKKGKKENDMVSVSNKAEDRRKCVACCGVTCKNMLSVLTEYYARSMLEGEARKVEIGRKPNDFCDVQVHINVLCAAE